VKNFLARHFGGNRHEIVTGTVGMTKTSSVSSAYLRIETRVIEGNQLSLCPQSLEHWKRR